LTRGADTQREEGNLLQIACEWGYVGIVEDFIKHGLDVNAGNASALTAASQAGNIDIIKMLLESGIDIEMSGGAALARAEAFAHVHVHKLLTEHGARPQSTDYSELISASGRGDFKAVERLLADGIDPNIKGPNGRAIDKAIKGDHSQVIKLLLDRGASIEHDQNILALPLRRAKFGIVKILVANGADPGAQKHVVLQQACSNGDLELVRLLLNDDIYTKIETNLRPPRSAFLLEAATNGHSQVVQHLVNRGALDCGHTVSYAMALIQASSGGYIDTVAILVTGGVDLSERNCGFRSLVVASCAGHVQVVNFLLNQHLDIKAFDCGYKALIYACYSGHGPVVKSLLSHGVRPDSEDSTYIALLSASTKGHNHISELFAAAGLESHVPASISDTLLPCLSD
jgi:ankyrin repeat protein